MLGAPTSGPRLGWTSGGRAPLESLLSLLQLSDSAFPSGRYTLSYGLETLMQSGHLTPPADVSTLITLLGDSIRWGVATSDGVALACAHRAVRPDGDVDFELIARVDLRLTAVKLSREAREASARTGRAVLATATGAFGESPLTSYADRVTRGARRAITRWWSDCSEPGSRFHVWRRLLVSSMRSPPAGSRPPFGSAW